MYQMIFIKDSQEKKTSYMCQREQEWIHRLVKRGSYVKGLGLALLVYLILFKYPKKMKQFGLAIWF